MLGRLRKGSAVLAIGAIALLGGLGLAAAPASASSPIVWNHTGGSIPGYCAPNQNYSNVCSWLPNSSQVHMVCWLDNTWFYGNYWSNRWFYSQSYATGRYVYLPASYVYYQVGTPHC